MIKKTLSIMGYIVIILTISVVFFTGLSRIIGRLYENQLVSDSMKEEAILKKQFYNNIEELCLEYALGENQILIQKFDDFLNTNHINKEHLLDYIRRLEIYNSLKYEDYLAQQKSLEDSFNRGEISKKTFKSNQEILLKKYENSLNSLIDYFSSNEKMIFENAKEEIEELFKLI